MWTGVQSESVCGFPEKNRNKSCCREIQQLLCSIRGVPWYYVSSCLAPQKFCAAVFIYLSCFLLLYTSRENRNTDSGIGALPISQMGKLKDTEVPHTVPKLGEPGSSTKSASKARQQWPLLRYGSPTGFFGGQANATLHWITAPSAVQLHDNPLKQGFYYFPETGAERGWVMCSESTANR